MTKRSHFRYLARRTIGAGLLALLLGAPLGAQRGALVPSRNLAELAEQAALIVRGHVVSARVEPHPDLQNLWTVVVKLRIEETLKGQAGEIFTFRQFIWDIRDRYDAAGYRKGQELVLLMNPPTRYGLSSPVGLEQGRFLIVRDQQGVPHAVNGHGNAGLFRELEEQLKRKRIGLAPGLANLIQQQRAAPVPLEDFKDLVRRLAGVN